MLVFTCGTWFSVVYIFCGLSMVFVICWKRRQDNLRRSTAIIGEEAQGSLSQKVRVYLGQLVLISNWEVPIPGIDIKDKNRSQVYGHSQWVTYSIDLWPWPGFVCCHRSSLDKICAMICHLLFFCAIAYSTTDYHLNRIGMSHVAYQHTVKIRSRVVELFCKPTNPRNPPKTLLRPSLAE